MIESLVRDSKVDTISEMEEKSKVSSAYYPLPQPLSFILRNAALQDSDPTGDPISPDGKLFLQRDDMQVAFEHLMKNCFVAIDDLYFSTYVHR
jgi:hypothetical protein